MITNASRDISPDRIAVRHSRVRNDENVLNGFVVSVPQVRMCFHVSLGACNVHEHGGDSMAEGRDRLTFILPASHRSNAIVDVCHNFVEDVEREI